MAGALVLPADVAGDRALLSAVTGVVDAVESEVAQRGELALNPVQPLRVARSEHQLDAVGRAPLRDFVSLVRVVVVTHAVEPPAGESGSQLQEKPKNFRHHFRSRLIDFERY